ncbi:MAG TPA: protein rep [Pyrinomonadaceae bacterium]|jgi:hypothetical protein
MSILTAQIAPSNRNFTEAAASRMRLSETIARKLESAAIAQSDAEALADSDMLRETAQPENFFTAENLSSSDGTFFDGYGSLTSTNSRIDPEYRAKSARRAQKRAVEYLNRCKPHAGEHLQLLTLTMPKTEADFEQAIKLLRSALVLLKKRQLFKHNVRGAVIGVEFTFGATGDHWHVHAHLLCWSKWINWHELGEQWTDCLRSAAHSPKLGANFVPTTVHSRAVVDVRRVTTKGGGSDTVMQEEAIRRVCRYIVKGSDFATVPQNQICDVRRILNGSRLIGTYGECNFHKGRRKKGADSYLVIENTNDGNHTVKETSKADRTNKRHTKRERRASLKGIGAEMIRQGQRQAWLELFKRKSQKQRAWRMSQLSRNHPHATFTTLSGRVWYGDAFVNVKPASASEAEGGRETARRESARERQRLSHGSLSSTIDAWRRARPIWNRYASFISQHA